ncbi:outer membrane beta-barrel protein [Emticicia sp. BO119]|uniref:outer membrane beta-barrel protein n=1 Tax=Emticicia sp. BO119 TaxID=2757768 RepID=UPI0015F03822|nr:outer membrane beta-barrel protein [Emticicia sp. BO119]MBA4851660.1 outer membrane beta-barrel protein [Emticicia sp. BO119]
MKKVILLIYIFSCFSLLSFSQTFPIHIQLTENNQSPVIGATVRIVNRADTTKILNNTTDTLGIARFNLTANQQYIMTATSVGYKTLLKGINATGRQSLLTFVMETDNQLLGTVVVTARKPLMQQEDDKTIVDPEPIANTSTSAYEIMEKIPGLFVDQDGNIYLSNSSAATIYINGREQKMSTADIAAILKSLPPNSIEKVEILRTPSAKYDASGSGGVVNIILKKGVKIGFTGSLSTGMNQGKYGNQFIGVSLNNSSGRLTSFLNLNYSHRNTFEQIQTTRSLSADKELFQNALTTFPGSQTYIGFGLGYELSKKWELNYDGRLNYNQSKSSAHNESMIRQLNSSEVITNNINTANNKGNNYSISQGINARYKIDSLGSEWTTDVAYNYFNNKTDQIFNTAYVLPTTSDIGGAGDIGNNRNFISAQTDVKYKLPHKITLETGLKATYQLFKSTTTYYTKIGEQQNIDISRTNQFNYNESIYAAYIQVSKTIRGFILKAGTRIENTNMNGHQLIPTDTSFKVKRTDLFPYIYLSQKLGKIAGYEMRAYLVHRRSITRPVYEYLNPSPRFIDQYLYEAGNPSLRPQFTQNFEANISFEDRPIFAIGRNYTQDIFTNVIYQNSDNPSVAYRTYDNLGKNQETYFRLLGAVPPGNRYFFVVGTQFNYNDYNGLYENAPLSFQRGSWSFFTFQQFKVDKLTNISLNGFFRLKGQQQFYELSNFGNLNLNVNRQFLNKKLMVALSITDVFYTNKNHFTINQGSISAFGFRQGDTRRVGLNVRYNFGFRKKEERNNPFNFENLERGSN